MNERDTKLKSAKLGVTVGIIIVAVCVIIMLLPIPDEVKGFLFLPAVAGAGVIIGFVSEKERIMRSYCPECGKKYDYENDVAWVETEENTRSGSNGETASLEATVEFTCTCENCGNQTSFSKKFTIARVDKDGNVKRSNLKDLARKYFAK